MDEKLKKQILKKIGRNEKYWCIENILNKNATYNVVIGERSNGKTYGVLEFCLVYYCLTGKKTALVRRYDADFEPKLAFAMWQALVADDKINKYTGGKWQGVEYQKNAWYFAKYEPDKKTGKIKIITAEEPFCLPFSLSQSSRYKSTSYPDIENILFDEFITRSIYMNDEFMLFMDVCSTIIRDRDTVNVFMLGNTVNKFCPYFEEMGLKHIREMQQGTIDVYRYGDTDLTVAVEYCEHIRSKDSDQYFAFDNPRLKMTTHGKWDIGKVYPHCPCKYTPKDVVGIFYIIFYDDTLKAEIVGKDGDYFIFIHRHTGDVPTDRNTLIYSPEFSPKPNYRRRITKPMTTQEAKIYDFFRNEKVFYSSNETGDIVRNYLLFCVKENNLS